MSNVYDLPEWAALIAAVKVAPDDDLPRKVAADWLDEHGEDERAEFVRVQCEIARLDMGGRQLPMGVGRERLLAREGELIRNGWDKWLGFNLETVAAFAWDEQTAGLEAGCGHSWYEWDRGFVRTVRAPLVALVGGRCGNCAGVGNNSELVGYDSGSCPQCGRCRGTAGVLRRLVRREPLAEVVVSDRQPWRVAGSVGRWGWSKHPDDMMFTGNRSVIPAEILDLIPEADDSPMRGFRHRRWFRTADAARSALSTACLAWAARPEEVPA